MGVTVLLIVDAAQNHDGSRTCVDLERVGAAVGAHIAGVEDNVPIVALVSAKLSPIGVENDLILAWVSTADTIILVGVGGVEVENEEELTLLRHNELVALIFQRHILV